MKISLDIPEWKMSEVLKVLSFAQDNKNTDAVQKESRTSSDYDHLKNILAEKLAGESLSRYTRNRLGEAGIHTYADIVKMKREDVSLLRYMGKKSLEEIDSLLQKNNLHYGMDLSFCQL